MRCDATHAAVRPHSALREQSQSLVPRTDHKQAMSAVAPNMLRTMFILLTPRQGSRAPGSVSQALGVRKNAPRWMRALKQYGSWPTPELTQAPIPALAH